MKIKLMQAVSSVRVGDGTAVGAVDLPLARERHTRWPFVPGSALKGALRGRARALEADPKAMIRVFGSEPPEDAGDREALEMGSLRLGQATLLALPVRSLNATFALLSCPTALARLGRAIGGPAFPRPSLHEACVAGRRMADERTLETDDVGAARIGLVFLEDLDLVATTSPEVAAWAEAIGRFGHDEVPIDHLVVVHDDVFAHACRAWTELRTRNAVEPSGVVKGGALFDVELLPSETLWWTALDGEDEGLLPRDGETFRLGGHQSVGMGRVTWFGGEP